MIFDVKLEQILVATGHTSVQKFSEPSQDEGRQSLIATSPCGQLECWLMNCLAIPVPSQQTQLTSVRTR